MTTTSAPSDDVVLDVEDLSVRYRGDIDAVRGVSLRCPRGSITVVLGPNGAGKTSLARALTGFLPSEQVSVSANRATFEGASFLNEPPDQRVRRGIVLVPERTKIFASMSVRENLRLGARSFGAAEQHEIDDLFPALSSLQESKAGLLSGGERQMLAIGRALLARPSLLVIDELSLGLAPRLTDTLLRSMERINRTSGMTIVLVEQAARAALRIANRVCVMRHGVMVWSGPAAELPHESAFEAVYLAKADHGDG